MFRAIRAPVINAQCAITSGGADVFFQFFNIIGFILTIFAKPIFDQCKLEKGSSSIWREQNSLMVMDVLGERWIMGVPSAHASNIGVLGFSTDLCSIR